MRVSIGGLPYLNVLIADNLLWSDIMKIEDGRVSKMASRGTNGFANRQDMYKYIARIAVTFTKYEYINVDVVTYKDEHVDKKIIDTCKFMKAVHREFSVSIEMLVDTICDVMLGRPLRMCSMLYKQGSTYAANLYDISVVTHN